MCLAEEILMVLTKKIEQKELLINFGSLKTASKYGIFTAG